MTELPEVEVARRAIEEHYLGKNIKRTIIADDLKVIDGVSTSDFEASMVGKTIVNAHRKGKYMWLQLDSSPFPSFQFGMAGAIYILKELQLQSIREKKIEIITVGGRTTAYVPESQKMTRIQAEKAPAKPREQTSKRSRGKNEMLMSDDDNDNVVQAENEDELNPDDAKLKKRKNPKGGGKKPPAKGK